jgi:UPF0716 protein FxsA
MRPFSILLAMFLIVPLLEIYLLIQVGGAIGAGWTIFLVVFTALLGAFLVRAQGFSTVRRIQAQLDTGELPAMELLEGLCLLIAGALLLTPGFFTDAVGFACLTTPLRRRLIILALERGLVRRPPDPAPRRGNTFNGDFRHLDE